MTPRIVGRDHGEMPRDALPEPTGVLSGCIILTLDGEVAVEHLLPGDRIVTRDGGMAVLKAIHRQVIHGQAVRILAGSLGSTRPDRDVVLPAGQMVLVRDWRALTLFRQRQAVAPAHALINGEFIRFEGSQRMRLHTLRFDSEHVIYADGLELIAPAQRIFRAKAA